MVETACDIIRRGLSRKDAADAIGVARDTLYHWLNRGQEALAQRDDGEEISSKEQQMLDFCLAIRGAEREYKLRKLGELDVTETNARVTALTWQLEKFAPDQFGSRARVEHSGPEGGPIKHEVNGDELLTRLAALAERTGGGNNPSGA